MNNEINFDKLFDGLTPWQVFKLGAVAMAHSQRAHARRVAKDTKARYESAQRSYRDFGGYDDCGPSYSASRDKAKALFDTAVDAKIAAEKYFQLTCREYYDVDGPEDKLTELVLGLAAQQNNHIN
jgi:hypothetical protein